MSQARKAYRVLFGLVLAFALAAFPACLDDSSDTPAPAPSGTEVTLTSEDLQLVDTYIRRRQPNSNEGGSQVLRLRDSGDNRALIRFEPAAIQGVLGTTRILLKAELELTIARNGENWRPVSQELDLHRLNFDWTESGATWNCPNDTNTSNPKRDCTPSWEMGPVTTNAFIPTPTAFVRIERHQTGAIRWDVTEDITAILTGMQSNYGWLLKKADEFDPGRVDFASSESGNPPRLVMEWVESPFARPDSAATFQDRGTELEVTTNDLEVAGGLLTITEVSAPLHGSAFIAGPGKVTYLPVPGFTGADSFSYTIVDAYGKTSTSTASIEVVALVTPPGGGGTLTHEAAITPGDDTYVRHGQPNQNQGTELVLTIRSSGRNRALVRFTETDLSQLRTLPPTASLTEARLELTVANNSENWGVGGRAIDLHALTNASWTERGATWNCALDSNTSNQRPDCSGATTWGMDRNDVKPWVATPTDTLTVTNATTGVLTFDVLSDLLPLVRNASAPHLGWVIKKSDENASGKLDLASRESATPPRLVLTIEDQNLPPDARDDFIAPAVGQPATIAVLANDTDSNGHTLFVLTTTSAQRGTVAVNANGTITYTPQVGTSGLDSFLYAVSDGHGGVDIARVEVAVPPAVPPDVTPPTITHNAGTATVYTAAPSFQFIAVVSDETPTSVRVLQNGREVAQGGVGVLPVDVLLEDGENFVQILARDSFGNETTVNLPVVVRDTAPPVWLPGSTPDPGQAFVQAPQPLYATVADSFGRVDRSSIQATLSGTLTGGGTVSRNLLSDMGLSSPDGDRTVSLAGAFGQLGDGVYTVRLEAADLAGNRALPDPLLSVFRIDTAAPVVLLGASGSSFTSQPVLALPITIVDQSPTRTRTLLNGIEVDDRTSTDYSLSLTLQEGDNTIEVISTDEAGNLGSARVDHVVLDTVPPQVVTILPPSELRLTSPRVQLSGTSSERLHLARVGGQLAMLGSSGLDFDSTITVQVPGDSAVTIEIEDLAGNSTVVNHVLHGPPSSLVDTTPETLPLGQGAFRLKLGSTGSESVGFRRVLLPIQSVQLTSGGAPAGIGSPSVQVDLGVAAERLFALAASFEQTPGTFSGVRFRMLSGEVERSDGSMAPVQVAGSGEVNLTFGSPLQVVEGKILELLLRLDVPGAVSAVPAGYELNPLFTEVGRPFPSPSQSRRLIAALGAAQEYYVTQASDIVQARVIRKSARFTEIFPGFTGIESTVTVEVQDRIAGSAPAQLDFPYAGGRFANYQTFVSHSTSFEIKEAPIILLQRTGEGTYVLAVGENSKVK